VVVDAERRDFYAELGAHPDQKRFIGKILEANNPEDENAVVTLDFDSKAAGADAAAKLMIALTAPSVAKRLAGGSDGEMPAPDDFAGKDADPDHAEVKATGLAALGEIDDIAIVA